MDIYKCPKTISEFTFGNQKFTILYILSILILKDHLFREATKGGAKYKLISKNILTDCHNSFCSTLFSEAYEKSKSVCK
jgi:hypothetical protein